MQEAGKEGMNNGHDGMERTVLSLDLGKRDTHHGPEAPFRSCSSYASLYSKRHFKAVNTSGAHASPYRPFSGMFAVRQLDIQAGISTHVSPRERIGWDRGWGWLSHATKSWPDAARSQRI